MREYCSSHGGYCNGLSRNIVGAQMAIEKQRTILNDPTWLPHESMCNASLPPTIKTAHNKEKRIRPNGTSPSNLSQQPNRQIQSFLPSSASQKRNVDGDMLPSQNTDITDLTDNTPSAQPELASNIFEQCQYLCPEDRKPELKALLFDANSAITSFNAAARLCLTWHKIRAAATASISNESSL